MGNYDVEMYFVSFFAALGRTTIHCTTSQGHTQICAIWPTDP